MLVGRGVMMVGVVAGASSMVIGGDGGSPEPDVSVDVWYDEPGQSVGDVEVGTPPDATWVSDGGFTTAENIGNQYAVRIRALFTPEVTGSYRFHLSSDDDSRLFVNPTGTEPAGARLMAFVAGWTTPQQWDRFASQRSEAVTLTAGTSYYLEAIGKEDLGDDHLSVGIEIDDSGVIEVIPGALLSPTELGAGGWRSATPNGLPSNPASTDDPGWDWSNSANSLDLAWTPVEDATGYSVRLEGSGEARTVDTPSPQVSFDGLVPLTRHLVEVTPIGDAGPMPMMSGVFFTHTDDFYTPAPPAGDGGDASVSYDFWDHGWWTLTSIAEGTPPSSSGTLTHGLEAPVSFGENHGVRLRAIVTPAVTGTYRFYLSSDDDGRLLFNPSGPTAAGAEIVAAVAGWTEQYQWDRYQSQRSQEFELQAGAAYYIEAMAVQALNVDHVEVGWSRDGGPIEVVPAELLSPTEEGAGGWRTGPADPGDVGQGGPTTTTQPTTTTTLPTTTTTTTQPTTTTTLPTTTTTTAPAGPAKLRLTFMCRAVAGGDITNDDYLDVDTAYPAGSYVWRVRSENEVGPFDYVVRVGNQTPFHSGVLQAGETQFFATDTGHRGASVHGGGAKHGTASANETACGVATTTTTAPATTTTTTLPPTTTSTTTTTVPDEEPTVFTGATDMRSYGLLAVGTGSCKNVEMSASTIRTGGAMRSNGDVKIWGGNVQVDGTVSYRHSTNLPSAPNIVQDAAVTVADLGFGVTDFLVRPAGFATSHFVHAGGFQTSSAVAPGIHYVIGDVNVSGSSIALDDVTIVATGKINISGSSVEMSPAADGLPTLVSGSDSCNQAAINISASSVTWDGTIVGLDGMVRISASDVRGGDIVAAAIRGSASSLRLD